MLLHCPNCNCNQDLKIKKDTGDVVCCECGSIVEVTSFMKKTMESRNEFLVEEKKAFTFPCKKCKKDTVGKYNKKEDKLLCVVCNSPLEVTQHMLHVIKTMKLQSDVGSNSETRNIKDIANSKRGL